MRNETSEGVKCISPNGCEYHRLVEALRAAAPEDMAALDPAHALMSEDEFAGPRSRAVHAVTSSDFWGPSPVETLRRIAARMAHDTSLDRP